MTTAVHVYLTVPIDGGEAPAPGSLEWTPLARVTATGPARYRLPAGFNLPLVEGEATADVAEGYWRVRERVPRGIIRHVYVPDVPAVEYTVLVDVDPATLATPEIDGGAPDTAYTAEIDGGTV